VLPYLNKYLRAKIQQYLESDALGCHPLGRPPFIGQTQEATPFPGSTQPNGANRRASGAIQLTGGAVWYVPQHNWTQDNAAVSPAEIKQAGL
jgi:hypothetical protein